ncbi:hypothetical protein F5Y14DRAFT_429283 [Nemania sp. NC0429]|nr:hypothetical protein F5Y14DRAFT_429283 [Nemania sp. NC0429]
MSRRENDMQRQPKSREYRPVTRAFVAADAAKKIRPAAEGESKGDKNPKLETEFLCGMDNWENHCDVVLDACENALLNKLGDKDDLTDDDPDSDSESSVAMEEEKKDPSDPELPEPVDPAFDNGYFLRSSDQYTKIDPRSYKYQMQVEKYQGTLDVMKYDEEVRTNDELYPKLLKQLRDVDEGREPRSLESIDKQEKEKKHNSDGDTDSDDDASSTKAELEAGADLLSFPQLQPKALQRVIDFFRRNPHVKREACEDFCKSKCSGVHMDNQFKNSRCKTSPYEVASDWKWPSGPGFQRPSGIVAYPSEFQFDKGYMVQVEADITGSMEMEELGVTKDAGMMTLFYFTFEELDKDGQLESARAAYNDLVPAYTYVGCMGLPPGHPQLFVWRIECPAGQPFSTDASYLGMRMNRQKYASIMRDLVDLVAAPLASLGSEGGKGKGENRQGRRNMDVQQLEAWPTALHNPRIDADNIIVRSDHEGIVGLLLWTTPSLVSLPLGASLLGLLCLMGTPLQEPGDTCISRWQYKDKPFHEVPVRKKVDPFPFKTYSRNAYDFERLMLHRLQAKVPALAQNPGKKESWEHVFSAMKKAVDVADHMADGDKESYREQISRMEWDWFQFPDKEEDDAQGVDEGYKGDVEKMEIDG